LALTRLQKILSNCGYGSRRDCEKLIAQKLVSINGITAVLGDKADPQSDEIMVDQKPIVVSEKTETYIILNKPINVLSEIKDTQGRKKVIDLVNVDQYLFIVGRLDYRSEGLILLTNDGETANRLTHPRYEHEKEYMVQVNRKPSSSELEIWRTGVRMQDGYITLPADVSLSTDGGEKGIWLKVILKEGKKRQIRETGLALGIKVLRIIRTRIGPIKLDKLQPGEWRYLSRQEISSLKKSCSSSY